MMCLHLIKYNHGIRRLDKFNILLVFFHIPYVLSGLNKELDICGYLSETNLTWNN